MIHSMHCNFTMEHKIDKSTITCIIAKHDINLKHPLLMLQVLFAHLRQLLQKYTGGEWAVGLDAASPQIEPGVPY
jgi:hypothetical protein